MNQIQNNNNGSFTQIPNEIIEKLYSSKLNGTQVSVCLFVIRKTYGWNKDDDKISLSQFTDGLGVNKSSITRNIKLLIESHIILVLSKGNQFGNPNKYSINTNFDEWSLGAITQLGVKRRLGAKLHKPSLKNATSKKVSNQSKKLQEMPASKEKAELEDEDKARCKNKTYKIHTKYNIQNKEDGFVKVINNFNKLFSKSITLTSQNKKAISKAFDNGYSVEDIDMSFRGRMYSDWWVKNGMHKDFLSMFREKTKGGELTDRIDQFKDKYMEIQEAKESDPNNPDFLKAEFERMGITKFITEYGDEAYAVLLRNNALNQN